jgi:hypothetical protein
MSLDQLTIEFKITNIVDDFASDSPGEKILITDKLKEAPPGYYVTGLKL